MGRSNGNEEYANLPIESRKSLLSISPRKENKKLQYTVVYTDVTRQGLTFFKKIPAPYVRKIIQTVNQNGNQSEPYITTGTTNAEINLKECIIRRLIPFISAHQKNDQIIVWPDLATSHYAKTVINHLEKSGIEYVQKKIMPQIYPKQEGL